MDRLAQSVVMGAAGAAGAEPIYVEDVFSTYLWNGNYDTTQSAITINNGIDLSGEGGLVWTKHRNYGNSHQLYDTERGAENPIYSNLTNGQGSNPVFSSFNSNGFSLTAGTFGTDALNGDAADTYTSWTFRKAEKFFDIVTWTGDGTDNRTISHNLGSVPGCIIVKKYTGSISNWYVYHRSLGANLMLRLDQTTAEQDGSLTFPAVPTSTTFEISRNINTSVSGSNYVAYLFAHDAGGFGDDGTESVIKCGSYTGTGSPVLINLGWEPQWIMVKRASTTTANENQDSWHILHNMSGWSAVINNSSSVKANTSDIENVYGGWAKLTSTGFYTGNDVSDNGQTFVYIAIRRGPMKTPEDATTVFNASVATSGNTAAGFPVDNWWRYIRYGAGGNTEFRDRLRGPNQILSTAGTGAEGGANSFGFDNMAGVTGSLGASNSTYYFRRAPGFFDVVAYTAASGDLSVKHNLGVRPEFLIIKGRNYTTGWTCWHSGLGEGTATTKPTIRLDQTNAIISASANIVSLSTTDFVVGNNRTSTNNTALGGTYIAYLFATVSGVSKVGSYTGTGTTLDVNCGFSAGARFVMIKRTDTQIDGETPPTGYDTDWYVWDTARGIVSGNDPYFVLNESDAENTGTDFIDPLSTGFQITSSAPDAINALNGTFIYLAIA